MASRNASKYFLATGVKADIEDFLTKFSESQTVRYQDFSELWRARNMSFIFCGRENEMELREFTEDLLRITTEFLRSPYSFQVQVGALYLLYGFYFKQPNNPRARIRFTQPTWQEMQNLCQMLHEEKHMDAEYVYLKLLHTHAFEFVHTLAPATPTGYLSMGGIASRDEGGKEEQRRQHLKDIEDSMLKDALNLNLLSQLHTNYHTMKVGLGPKGSRKPHTSLDVIQNNFTGDIHVAIDRHEDWRQKKISGKVTSEGPSQANEDSDSDPDWAPDAETSVGQRRAMIKERAFQFSAQRQAKSRHINYNEEDVSSAFDNIGSNRKRKTDSRGDEIQFPGVSASISEESSNDSDEPRKRKGRGKGRGKTRGKGRGKRKNSK